MKLELRNKIDEQAKKIEGPEAYIREGTKMCEDNIKPQTANCEEQKEDIKQKLYVSMSV